MPLGDGDPLERGVKKGHPPKKMLFYHYWLV